MNKINTGMIDKDGGNAVIFISGTGGNTLKESEYCADTRIDSPTRFTMKIGGTTYEVLTHFSKTSTETLKDKVKRLILNDYASQNSRFL